MNKPKYRVVVRTGKVTTYTDVWGSSEAKKLFKQATSEADEVTLYERLLLGNLEQVARYSKEVK